MKKIIGLLLVLTMIISVLPLGVYAADAEPINLLTLSTTKEQSHKTTNGSWSAVNANLTDSSSTNYWWGNASNKDTFLGRGWLAYDFQTPCRITSVKLTNCNANETSINYAAIEGSQTADFAEYVTLGDTGTTNPGKQESITVNITDETKYRYIRIRKYSPLSPNLILSELEINGYFELGNLEVMDSNITEGQTGVTNIDGIDCISLTFNQSINPSTVFMGKSYSNNADSIQLTHNTNNNTASGLTEGTATIASRDDVFLTNNNSTLNIPINHLPSDTAIKLTIKTSLASVNSKKLASNYVLNFTTGKIEEFDLPATSKAKNVLKGKTPIYCSAQVTDAGKTQITDGIVGGQHVNVTPANGYLTYDLLGAYKPLKFEFYAPISQACMNVKVYGSNTDPGSTPNVANMDELCALVRRQAVTDSYQAVHCYLNTTKSYRYITIYQTNNNFRTSELCLIAEVDTLTDKFGCDTTPVDFAVDTNGNLNASFQLINTTAEAVTVNVPNMLLAVYNEAEGADILVAATALTANTERDVTLASKANETVTVTVPASALSGKSYTKAKLMFIDDWSTLKPYCPAREAVFENQ